MAETAQTPISVSGSSAASGSRVGRPGSTTTSSSSLDEATERYLPWEAAARLLFGTGVPLGCNSLAATSMSSS